MAWSSGLSSLSSDAQPSTVALITTLVIGAVLFCHQLARHLFPRQPRPKPKQVKKDIVVRIQEIPVEKSVAELKNDLLSLAVQDQQLETTVNGLDRVTLARINNDDACATVIFPMVFSQSELLRRLAQASKEASLPYGFDCDFFGITPLTDADGDDAVDIVAVPGLASHPIGSWKSSQRGNSKVWLRDFLPRDIPNARVLLYGYDSKLLGSDSRQSIEDMSIMLLNLLSAFRAEGKLKHRPIIFVGHSLGGLLVKECLLQAMKRQTYDSHHGVYQACCGLLLFGVPNHGLNNSQLLSIVQNQANESLIRDLILDTHLEPSMFLKRISTDFSERCGSHSPVVCFYETRLSPTVQILPDGTLEKSGPSASMVTTHSATAFVGQAGEPAVPFNVDHSGLVKFDSRSHELYVVVLDRLKRLVVGSRDRMRKRISDNLSAEDQRIWNSLNDPPYSAFRNSAKLPKPEEGTLEWLIQKGDKESNCCEDPEFDFASREQDEELLRSEVFQRWRDASESSSLLVTAPPGSGKSVLSNFVIQHLEAEASHSTKVIYYFCSIRADETAPNARSVLRSLILQLCEARATLFRLLPTDWADKDKFKGAAFSILLDIFGQLLRHGPLTRVYCVIDGLDVYDDPAMVELVHGLRKIWKSDKASSHETSHLFCTSRPNRNLLDAWGSSEFCRLRCNRDDIKTFVEQRVSRLGSDFDHRLKDFIRTQLLLKSEQSFLWLDVVVRRIEDLELPTQTEVTNEIESSSRDLDDLYRFLIQRAAGKNSRLLRILTMVIYAERPLTCAELEHAVAINIEPITETHSYANFITNVAHLNPSNITKALGTLLDVVEGRVMAVHQSLKDFFQHKWESLSLAMSISPTVYPAYVLMKYLCLYHADEPEEKFPLFDYAGKHWHRHVPSEVEIYSQAPLMDVLEHLLGSDPDSGYSTRKGDLFSRIMVRRGCARNAQNAALMFDLGWLIKMLLDNKIDSRSLTHMNAFLAWHAVMDSNISVLRAIISHGTKATIPLEPGTIENLCKYGNRDMFRLLLEKRADEVHVDSHMVLFAAENKWRYQKSNTDTNTLVKIMLSKCGSGVQITSEMLVAMALSCTASTLETVLDMASCRVEITVNMLERMGGRILHPQTIALLLARTRGKVDVTETMLVNAARSSDGRMLMEIFFDEREEEVQVTERVLREAVTNWDAAPDILELLFKKRHSRIHITEKIFKDAVNNPLKAMEVIKILFREKKTELQVTNEILVTAAKNVRGREILEFLFERRGHEEMHLTAEVLSAAASNKYSTTALHFVCDRMGGAIEITPELVTAAAGSKLGHEMLQFLFEMGGDTIQVPQEAITAAAGNSTADTLRFLLKKGHFEVTEEAVLAAISRYVGSEAILKQLLNYGGSDIRITPKVAFAVTKLSFDTEEMFSVANLLLDIDRAIVSVVHDGHTLITSAARRKNFALVDRLLEVGMDPDFSAPNQQTALAIAMQGADYNTAERLVRAGANTNVKTNEFSLLAVASKRGHHEIIEVLLRGGADVTTKNVEGWTSLALASSHGRYKAVELLLREGSDPSAETDDGQTCLTLACRNGHFEVAILLLEAYRTENTDNPNLFNDSLPEVAAKMRETSYFPLPPKPFNLSIGKKDVFGRTPIWYAAAGGHMLFLKSLIQLYPEATDERDGLGISPFSAAVRTGRMGVVHVLLASGLVQTESRDCLGKLALWWAKRHHLPAMVQLLSQPVMNSVASSAAHQEETEFDIFTKGYCDICLMALPSIKGALYRCKLCRARARKAYIVICESCIQEGGHCLDSSHQLTLLDEAKHKRNRKRNKGAFKQSESVEF